MRVLIVDDEPISRRGVRRLLNDEPDVEIIGECSNGVATVEAIERERPDLVILDIQMPEMNGIEVVSAMGAAAMPAVIFLTAYDEYAVRAFDLSATDYVLKPVDEERFRRAIERARTDVRGAANGEIEQKLRSLLQQIPIPSELEERFVVRSAEKIRFVPADEIEMVTAEENYVRLHTSSESHLLRETVTRMEERLDRRRFVRIRRSTIVRIEAIREIQPLINGAYQFTLTSGARVSSSRHFRENVEALLGR
jgi:two-component system, LytTR family, response regulator